MAQFSRNFLERVIQRDSDAEVIEDNIIDHLRWEVVHLLVFKFKGKFYQMEYLVPATEAQEVQPFKGAETMIDVMEVKPVMIATRQWVSVHIETDPLGRNDHE